MRLIFKTIILLIVVLVHIFLISLTAYCRALIIDHTCRDISIIPAQWVDAVKTMVLHHTGQSHGNQIPHGMINLENENSLFGQEQSENGIPPGIGLKITRGQLSAYNSWTISVGIDRYWQGVTGRAWTERTLSYHFNNGYTVHASLHTWCWHLQSWTAAQVNEYLMAMEILEKEYPNVTFIYMTDTCDTDGDTGYNRFLRNEQIREFCRNNDKVLFDFADLESWSADGTVQNTYFHVGSGLNIPYWHEDWRSDPYYNDGHINEAACTMKAKAMWWLLARLAGWNPTNEPYANFSATPLSGKSPLTVSFTNRSTGYFSNCAWDFENNGSADSNATNPIHTYVDTGTYNVSLTISGPMGSDTLTRSDFITVTNTEDSGGSGDDDGSACYISTSKK